MGHVLVSATMRDGKWQKRQCSKCCNTNTCIIQISLYVKNECVHNMMHPEKYNAGLVNIKLI